MTTRTILTARQRAVLEALRGHGSMTSNATGWHCGLTHDQCRYDLVSLMKQGLVSRQRAKKWTYTPFVWSIEDVGVRALEVGDG